jgi:predicted DNA-binding transcriptional regulator YafY
MRRADRLFQIIQILRHCRLTTARHLAKRLEVSERTVYRDIRDLISSGVPIEGEAGVGYVLPRTFDVPPLMFTADEIEALVLGVRVVEAWADADLVRAARSLLEKVQAVLPAAADRPLDELPLFSVSFTASPEVAARVAALRGAVRDRRKTRFRYVRADGQESERTVRPLCLTLMMTTWLLTAWCETKRDFRNFRLDRMSYLEVLDEVFGEDEARSLEAFLRTLGDRCREEEA